MKINKLVVYSIIGACAIMPVHASATSIALFNTGVDASGIPVPNGASDPHYTLVGTYAGTRTQVLESGYPIGPWIGANSVSAWVGPVGDSELDGNVDTYDYQTTFSLGALYPATASIIGQWAADNEGIDILINGVSTGNFVNGFDKFSAFSIRSGFVAGTNTIDFLVHNDGGPTGLRVEMTGVAAVPEPATWAMMLVGMGMIGFAARRRHNVSLTYA